MIPAANRRILMVDDNVAIHEDFKKILGLGTAPVAQLADAKAAFFGAPAVEVAAVPTFTLESAHQGQEALALVQRAVQEKRPYAMAFVDVRMPPGWDGIETISRLWEVDPDLQAVVCTAFADYSWDQMIAKLGRSDRLLILKKPFDPVEVQQMASSLTEKWNAQARERARFEEARAAEQEARAYAASLVTTNRALETARAGAVAAMQAKSEFLANMSHEIRTPMIAILGHADLLSDSGLPEPERQEHLVTIREQGTHLLTMISDILDIAAIETGRLVVEKTSCSVRLVLEEIRERFLERAQSKGVSITSACDASLPQQVRCDAARLRQLLGHLVGNAVKFTDSGNVKLQASFEKAYGSEGGRLKIAVVDTGIGITLEQRSRLFEAFAQADGSLTRKHGGAGLGLALSRRLVQHLGGDLDVESTPGQGSRFTLTLEVEGADVPEPATAATAAAPSTPLHGRVLLVEDVLSTQRLYSLYLRRAGAEVDVCENGQSAVDKVTASMADRRPYDLVLMDMQMPVLDGYSATRILRDRGFEGPVLAVTAHALAGDRERCIEAGCNDYCAKPANREELIGVCRELMQKSVKPALPQSSTSPSSTSQTATQTLARSDAPRPPQEPAG
jgi:two-component system sensor histidine kinase/response regulator